MNNDLTNPELILFAILGFFILMFINLIGKLLSHIANNISRFNKQHDDIFEEEIQIRNFDNIQDSEINVFF